MHLSLDIAALALAFTVPTVAEGPRYTTAITGSGHPSTTPAPKGPRPTAQVAGLLTISVTNYSGE